MDPRDFYDLAARLREQSGPAEYRSSVSRAYYAAFNAGKAELAKGGVPVESGYDAHSHLRECLARSGAGPLRTLGGVLRDLHTLRKRADYDLHLREVEGRSAADQALSFARRCFDLLDSFRAMPEDQQAQAIRRMKGYVTPPGRSGTR